MKKLMLLIGIISMILINCATPQPTPDIAKIHSITETKDCKFIKGHKVITTKNDFVYYVARATHHFGGDSYKILHMETPAPYKYSDLYGIDVIFEIYKCEKE